jgi:predicted methyltransferase
MGVKASDELKKDIIKCLLNGDSIIDISKMYNISVPFIYKIRSEAIDMGYIERIIKKGSNYQIRVTSYIRGSIKSKFIKDCLDNNYSESKMSNHVFDTYYYLYEIVPDIQKIEPNKIKDYLKARIKL